MKSIVLINCYFGKLPEYFDLFLKSCKYNPTIDFYIYTDCEYSSVPQNVYIKKYSFEELKEKIQNKFDFDIVLNNPYKLCDYKPTYGFVFENEIKKYDFWGYCDIDLLFGNIRKFLNEKILNEYEKIYQLGHLTLYRNTYDNNRIFMKEGEPYYKEVFSTNTIEVFDEAFGIQKKFERENKKIYIQRDYADISPRYYRFKLSDYFIDIKPKDNNYKHQIFMYDKGSVYRYYLYNGKIQKDEFIYIHFQKRNMVKFFNEADSFFVTYKGFIRRQQFEIDRKQLREINKFNLFKQVKITIGYNMWKIKRKINKMKERGSF